MLKRRIMCLLSVSLLLTSYNVNAQTPLKATEVVKDNNIKETVHINKMGLIEQPIERQIEKDKIELEKRQVEEQRQKELKRLEEEEKQRQRDLTCYYNPNNVSEISGISVQKAYKLLQGTTYQDYTCAEAFVNAEKLDQPINALFLISLTIYESGHGKNVLAQQKNNISSWRVSRGWKGFSSKADCIYQTSKMISDKYLNPKGEYYRGNSIFNIGINYCETNNWAKDVNVIANEIRNIKTN